MKNNFRAQSQKFAKIFYFLTGYGKEIFIKNNFRGLCIRQQESANKIECNRSY